MFYGVVTHTVLRAKKLLSLVTFFAAAKKVTPAPGRGTLTDLHEYKLNEKNQNQASSNSIKDLAPERAARIVEAVSGSSLAK